MLNFKKIELRGFKSFADKVEIPFQEGVTAIIGPNGCGKSNVAEAIKWALGEHRAKQLRGRSMQDVIFAGTEKRKSMSYAEVTLTFDNKDQRIFPGINYDEVVFTRKLDRSGDSEYFINHNKVRMKDIINLIHDTGIGKDGYSIIGQGRVSEILSAKPDERRNIFEEAAGISKYRAQRIDAERNLEKASMNLQTANEIIAEIEHSIGPLKKQAETAKRYTELKEDLQNKEVNLYIYNYEHNQEMKQTVNDKLDKINQQISEYDKLLKEATKKYELLMFESSSIDKELSDNHNELLALSVTSEKASGAASLLKEKIDNLTSELSRLNDEITEIDHQLEYNTKLITQTLENKEKFFNDQLKLGSELEIKINKHKELSSKLTGQESDWELKNLDYASAVEKLDSLTSNYSNFIKEKGIIESRIASLNELLNNKKISLNEAETNASIFESSYNKNYSNLQNVISEYNELLTQKKELGESLESFKLDLEALNNQLVSENSKLELLIKIKEEYSSFQTPVKLLMQDSKKDQNLSNKIIGVFSDIINVPKEYVVAIEYALGGVLQNIVVDNERDAADLITYLKQKNIGRCTFLPLTSFKNYLGNSDITSASREPGCFGVAANLISYDSKYQGIVNRYLGNTLIVNNLNNAIYIYKKYNQKFRIVTLDGEIFATSGEITGGSIKSSMSEILSQEQKIEAKKQQVSKLQKNISLFTISKDNAKQEFDNCIDKIEEHLSLINKLNIDVNLSKERLDNANNNKNQLSAEIENHINDLDEANSNLKEIDKQLNQIDELKIIVKEKKENLAQSSQNTKGEKDKSNEEINKLSTEITELKVAIASLKSSYDQSESDLYRLNTEKGTLEDSKIITISQIKDIENQLGQIKGSVKNEFSKEDLERIEFLKKQIDEYEHRKKVISKEISDANTLKEDYFSKTNDLTTKKVRNEAILENIDIDMRNLQQHILEEYNLTYSSALVYRDPEFNKELASHDIAVLKKDINSLGPVNLLAIETLKESEERLEVQTKQRDDIQKAYDDIVKIIEVLTEEMRDKFINSFEKINENFKVVFEKLFGGGKGELRLDTSETEDVLECGIDIFAQPPGKSLKNISLLSGGEQALTAIGILFAILKLKPMPFCVLDEIEAALDDSNVRLFAQFLKRFSDYTQFIVITHRKPTMELADTIFGVTMEEKGVTKIVSVELEEAVKHAKQD